MKRCEPHMCVAELTSHVACNPTVVRRKMPQSTHSTPPMASRITPRTVIGTQCHLLIHVWNLSLRRSGTYGNRSAELLCMARPVTIHPMLAQNPPSFGECGSPSLSVFG